MVYKFKLGSRFAVPPQVVGEALERLAGQSHGSVTPAMVVDEARADDSPLHPAFEWHEDVAAELYREEQARHLMRAIIYEEQVADDGPPRPIQAYVHVRTEDGPGYMASRVAMATPDLREQVLNDALKMFEGLRRRYEHIRELSGVFDAIDRLFTERARARARAEAEGKAKAKAKARRRRRAKQPTA